MLKRAVKWASIVLALLALAYFVRHALHTLQGHDLSALVHDQGLWGMALLTLLYTATIATTAAAWKWQLAAVGHRATYGWTITVLAVTQFGKYLPGNVGHHIGRAGLAIDAGVRMSAALLTIGYELLLAIVAAAHLCAIGVLLWPPAALAGQAWLEHRWTLLALVSTGAVAGLLLAPHLVAMLTALRGGDRGDARVLSLDLRTIVGSYAMYVVGQIAVGVGLWGLALALLPAGSAVPSALFFVGAFATSWIAGLVVPGAPAGLGVREVVLAAWLADALPPDTAVLLVLAMRVATTIGDAINFGWGSWALARRRAKQHLARDNG